MSIVELVDVLLVKQRRVFIAVLVLAFATAAIVTFALPKQYAATATLFVGENRPIATGANSVPLDEVLAQTYRELLATPTVREQAARKLRTDADALAGKLRFDIASGTRLLRVTATDGDPQRAQTIANTYASSFVRERQRTVSENSRERLEALENRIRRLAVQVDRLEGRRDSRSVARRASASSELEAARRTYASLTENSALEGSTITLSSLATVPGAPVRPKPRLYLAVGALAALLLATAAAFLRNAFDKRIRDDSELEALFDAPILARIPEVRGSGDRGEWVLQESLQFLRTNLQLLLGSGQASHVIAVTAARPADGKTFVLSRLARALARSGDDVIAVECDLRRPALAQRLSVDPQAAGVSNLLMELRDPAEFLATTSDGVRVLGGGPMPPNPSFLFSTARLPQLFDALRTKARYVVVDTPPVLAGAETSTIASLADGVLLVIDVKGARRDVLAAAQDQLSTSGARVLGVILNRVSSPLTLYGYGYAAASPPAGDDDRPESREPARGAL